MFKIKTGSAIIAGLGSAMIVVPASHLAVPPSKQVNHLQYKRYSICMRKVPYVRTFKRGTVMINVLVAIDDFTI